MENTIKEFLINSPYSEKEKAEITLYIQGLKETEKAEFLDLMNLANRTILNKFWKGYLKCGIT